MSGYALLFRWKVKKGRERAFAAAWEEVTRDLLAQNSRGSVLFRAGDGTFCAIARWPDVQTREAANIDMRVIGARAAMAEAIEESLEVLELNEVINLWLESGGDI